jgi:hypothetical protein
MTELRELVYGEGKALLDGKDSIEEAVVTRPHRAQTVAVGLLALGDITEAKEWFQALTEEWLIYTDSSWEAKYEQEPMQSAQLGPWDDYISGIYSSILGQENVERLAETVHERSTAGFVDGLDNRAVAHRIDLARALSALLLEESSVDQHLDVLERYVRDRGKPWAVDRYLPYASVIRGLSGESVGEVHNGIDGLLDFHRNRVAGARDADTVQKAVALDAAAMLALARRSGIGISVDHDLIPSALNDESHYPVRT